MKRPIMIRTYAIMLCSFLLLLSFRTPASSEGFRFTSHRHSEKIPAKIAHNLVIIPVQINDSPPVNFILDTGVRTTLITEPVFAYMLDLPTHETVWIMGLGNEGIVEAIRSKHNTIRIGNIKGEDMDLIILPDDIISFSEVFGFPVYGIIGYDFFKNFPVKINYVHEFVRVYRNAEYPVRRNSMVIPFELVDGKPYAKASVTGQNGEVVSARLLLDLGASHPLYLNRDYSGLSFETITSFLGKGLSGNLMGSKGRVKSLELSGQVTLMQPIAAYPDQDFYSVLAEEVLWTGIIGGGVFRRFHVTFDYLNERMILRKNMFFNEDFYSNLSGIEVSASDLALNRFEIYYVRPNSVAYERGIRAGDEIVAVNGIQKGFSLIGIEEELTGSPGKPIHLTLSRDGEIVKKRFRLREDLIKQKLPAKQQSGIPDTTLLHP